MEKKYISNVEYNRTKKRNCFILGTLLILSMGGLATVFLMNGQTAMAFFFGAFVILPLVLIPSVIKLYPTDGRDILTITDKLIITKDGTYKLKEIMSYKVTISLASLGLDSENQKLLNKVKKEKPIDEYFGDIDFIVKDVNGKSKTIYVTIDHVIDALNTLLELGVKHYELTFSLKRNVVKNEYDILRDITLEKEKQLNTLSKKEKIKQLI